MATRFDWLPFLKRHGIDYITRGPSTSRDNVNVHCPLCGSADDGHHLGISLKGKGWHCWKNDAHAGKSRVRLIQLLLRVDEETARELAGDDAPAMPDDMDMGEQVRAALLGEHAQKRQRLRLLPEFKRLDNDGIMVKPFQAYMRTRGYAKAELKWATETYNLHYATRGPFAQRIVIPIYDQWNRLLTWTARTIRERETLRYRALGLTATADLPAAKFQPQDTVLGLPYLWMCENPKVLVVVEGPFDAFWITLFGRTFGVHATCLFGLNLSVQQVALLEGLGERFQKRFLVLDSGASMRSFKLANSGLQMPVRRLDASDKDPAEMDPGDVVAFALSCLD